MSQNSGKVVAAHILGHVAVGREPDDAAAPRERANGLGGFQAARRIDRADDVVARIRVGDGDRFRRVLDRVKRCALAAVGQVDQDADLVHLLDRLAPEARGEPAVIGLPVAGADIILKVVSELHDADAEIAKRLEQVDIVLDRRCVLKAEQDCGSARRHDLLDLPGRGRDRDDVRVFCNEAPPARQEGDRFARILPDRHAHVDAAEAALSPLLEPATFQRRHHEPVDDRIAATSRVGGLQSGVVHSCLASIPLTRVDVQLDCRRTSERLTT
jgi:hypothetical protein